MELAAKLRELSLELEKTKVELKLSKVRELELSAELEKAKGEWKKGEESQADFATKLQEETASRQAEPCFLSLATLTSTRSVRSLSRSSAYCYFSSCRAFSLLLYQPDPTERVCSRGLSQEGSESYYPELLRVLPADCSPVSRGTPCLHPHVPLGFQIVDAAHSYAVCVAKTYNHALVKASKSEVGVVRAASSSLPTIPVEKLQKVE